MNKLEEILEGYNIFYDEDGDKVMLKEEVLLALTEAYQLGRNNTADWIDKNSSMVFPDSIAKTVKSQSDLAKTTKDLDI